MTSQQGIPSAEDLAGLLASAPTEIPIGPLDTFARAVVDLHACNLFQWRGEADIRTPSLTAFEVARVKRAIDVSNKKRARLVERLDQLCTARLRLATTGLPDGHINSETIGQLVDRLSILTLKIFFVRERADQPGAGDTLRASCEAHAHQLETQRLYVATCYDRFLGHLRRGSGSMLVSGQFKYYEDADL